MSNSSLTAPASTSASATSADVAALVGRIALAAIFILSGISKITAPAYAMGYIASVGLPLPGVALAAAIAVEIGGGIALVLGYRTRLVAAVIALFSVATAVFFHNQLADQNQFIHFFKNIAIAGGLLQVVVLGGGRLSLDGRR